jgi:hypothetical protein
MSEPPAKSCTNCLLRAARWPGAKIESETGFCIWFLKKLKLPRPIPPEIVPVGCANWRPGKTAMAQGLA